MAISLYISDSDTIGSFIEKLNGIGVTASYNDQTGIFSVDVGEVDIVDTDNTGIIDALHLEGVNEGYKSNRLQIKTVETVFGPADESTKLSELGTGITITGTKNVIVQNTSGDTYTIELDSSTTVGQLLQAFRDAGMSAEIEDGYVMISGGTITGGTFNAVSALGLDNNPYTSHVTGEALTETIIEYELVTYDTKLVDDLGVTEGYLEVIDADNNTQYLKIYSGQTIGDLMADLANMGIASTLDEDNGILTITGGEFHTLSDADVQYLAGNLTIVEPDARYIKGTNLLECLYGTATISVTQTEVASTFAMSRALTKSYTQVISATDDTLLSELGITTTETIKLHKEDGSVATFDVNGNTSLGSLMQVLNAMGVSAWLDDGVLKIEGGWMENTTVETALGLEHTTASSYVVGCSRTVTKTHDADSETTMAELGLGLSTITVSGIDGVAIGTVTTNADMTIGEILTALAGYGISGSITNGVISLDSDTGAYVTGGVMDSFGVGTSTTTFTTTIGTTNTSTALVSATYTITADSSTTLGSLGLGASTISVSGVDGDAVGTITTNAAMTIGDVLTALAGYGISGTIKDGKIYLDSDIGNYATGGVLTSMGVGTSTTTHTTTAGTTNTSTAVVSVTYSVTADSSTTLGSLGLGASTISVNGVDGDAVGTITTNAAMTIGDVLTALAGYGISGTIKDGKIYLDSDIGNYATGGVLTSMGVGTSATTHTTTAGTTNTSTAVVSVTYSITADSSTTLGQLDLGASTISVNGVDGVAVGTITTNAAMTIGDVLTALAGYGISGTIKDGKIYLDSDIGNYATGGVLTSMGIGTSTTTYITTTGTSATSSIAITYSTTTYSTTYPTITETVKSTHTIVTTGAVTGTETITVVDTVTDTVPIVGTKTLVVSHTVTTTQAVIGSQTITVSHTITTTEPVVGSETITITQSLTNNQIISTYKTIIISSSGSGDISSGDASTYTTVTVSQLATATFEGYYYHYNDLGNKLGSSSSTITIKYTTTDGDEYIAGILTGSSTYADLVSVFNGMGLSATISGSKDVNICSTGATNIKSISITSTSNGVGSFRNQTTSARVITRPPVTGTVTQLATATFQGYSYHYNDIGNKLGSSSSTITIKYTTTDGDEYIAGILTGSNTYADLVSVLNGMGLRAIISGSKDVNICSTGATNIKSISITSTSNAVGSIQNQTTTTRKIYGSGSGSSSTSGDGVYTLSITCTEAVEKTNTIQVLTSFRFSIYSDFTIGSDQSSYTINDSDYDTITVVVTTTNNVSQTHTMHGTVYLSDLTDLLSSYGLIVTPYKQYSSDTSIKTFNVTATGIFNIKSVSIGGNTYDQASIVTGSTQNAYVTNTILTTTVVTHDVTFSIPTSGSSLNVTITIQNVSVSPITTQVSTTHTIEKTSTTVKAHTILQTVTVEKTTTTVVTSNYTKSYTVENTTTGVVTHTVSMTFTVDTVYTTPVTQTITSTAVIQKTTYTITTTTSTATMSEASKFSQLSMAADGTVTVNSAGTLYTVTVETTDTVGDLIASLAGLGIYGTVNGGKITFTGDDDAFITAISSNVATALGLTTAGKYTTTGHTTTSNTTSNEQRYQTTNTLTTDDTFSRHGLTTDGTVTVVSDGTQYIVTVKASDTIDDMLTTLAGLGIKGSVTGGKITLQGDGQAYIKEISSNLNTLFKIGTTNYTTTGHTTTSNTTSNEQRYQTTNTLTTDDTFSRHGLTTDGTVTVVSDGTQYIVTVKASDTIDDMLTTLAGLGIKGSVTGGKITLQGDSQAYIKEISSNLNTLFKIGTTNYATTGHTTTSNTTSNEQNYQTTNTLSTDDTLARHGLTANGTITLVSDGTQHIVTVKITDTIDDMLTTLAGLGINGYVNNGYLSFKGDEQAYITGISSNLNSVLKLGATNYSTQTHTITANTDSDHLTHDVTTLMSDATLLTDLGITNGNIKITEQGSDYTYYIDTSVIKTIGDFRNVLADYGFTSYIDNNGRLILSGVGDSYLTSITGGSNIITQLDLDDWTFGEMKQESDHLTDTTIEDDGRINGDTLLTELQDDSGNSLGITTGEYVVYQNGVRTTETITNDTTVDDFIATLGTYGMIANVNTAGNFEIGAYNNTYLATSNSGGINTNAIDVLFAEWNFVNVYTSNNIEIPQDVIVSMTRETKLADINEGTYVDGCLTIVGNGIETNISLTADDTVGTLMDELELYGFKSVINDSGQLIIKSDSDYTLKEYLGPNKKSNVLTLLGLQDSNWIITNTYSNEMLETSEVVTTYTDANDETLIKDLDIVWNNNALKAQGTLALNVDGMLHKITIDENETIGSLKEKFAALGLETTISNGELVINSGYQELVIDTANTTSNIANDFGLVYHDDLGGYSASNDNVEQTISWEEDVVLSVSDYAGEDTALKLLNITSGTLTVYRDGEKATLNVDSNQTLGALRAQLATKFGGDVDIKFEHGILKDGYLEFYSKTGASVEVGATTDTSNMSAICGFVNDKSGTVKSARELYRVNAESKVTTADLFRRGDVTEGTFTVGDAVFTIDENTTLKGIINQINASESSNATAYWDSVDGKLVIKSRTTGSSFINIEAGTSNFTDVMGYTSTDVDPVTGNVTAKRLDVNTQEVGENAVFAINGTTYSSTSNTIQSDVSRITGVTINLKGVSEGEEITLTVERDKETVANAVSDIVDAYNELIENVDKEITKGGALDDQFSLKLIRNQIRSLMTSSIAGTNVFKNLDAVGISLDKATAGNISTETVNVLNFNKDKFLDAFGADQEALKGLLVGTDTNLGVFRRIENVVEQALSGVYGYFAAAEKSYNTEISRLDTKIRKATEAVAKYRERLEAKFASMDLLIANMQNQYSSFLG